MALTALSAALAITATQAQTVKIGVLTSHESEVAPISISFHDGLADYVTLANVRDGGVDGVDVEVVSCETRYTLEGHMQCYQELAAQGAVVAIPSSTEGAYALNRMAFQVGVPVMNGGLGQTAVADGEAFPNSFAFPANYYQAASAMIEHFEAELGGLEGRRIAYVYHDSLFGQEAIPLLQGIAQREGFTLDLHPVAPPGDDQRAVWGAIAQSQPDRVILWTVGRMTAVSIGTAAAVQYPREQMMGIWWTTLELMMRQIGPAADGMRAMSMSGVGHDVAAYNDLNEMVYFGGLGHGTMNNIGDIDYNRGLTAGLYLVEAAKAGMAFAEGGRLTGEAMRRGLETLDLTAEEIEAKGFGTLAPPLNMSCGNHSGGGLLQVIEYDAQFRRWENYGDYVAADDAVVDAAIAAASGVFTQQTGLPRRSCNAPS
ncbi:ABC transporter substrate-binding protein [Pontivivens ytuae]|uniref:ABC transporter substrate-binding protein n=1 Tax=Pontivivens ytuae TaxID=2789856 RepID=A0A7S9LSP2_9RHOB|nr:ABC transporter substrate-binding protein [Pontivivens ytuae]QPH54538.1 ABC transporter substrate-binding protein [Pontivivens ytuae]